jgi:hypothetical protein
MLSSKKNNGIPHSSKKVKYGIRNAPKIAQYKHEKQTIHNDQQPPAILSLYRYWSHWWSQSQA